MTGVYLGIASGLAVATVALLWLGEWRIAACVLGGIAGSVTCASAIGIVMPNLIRFFNREPQVAAGPVALASTDMVTLLIYFTLARMLIASVSALNLGFIKSTKIDDVHCNITRFIQDSIVIIG